MIRPNEPKPPDSRPTKRTQGQTHTTGGTNPARHRSPGQTNPGDQVSAAIHGPSWVAWQPISGWEESRLAVRDGTRKFLDEPVYYETYFMIPVTLRFNQGLKDLGAVRPLGPFGGGRVAGDPGPGMAPVEPPGRGAAPSGPTPVVVAP